MQITLILLRSFAHFLNVVCRASCTFNKVQSTPRAPLSRLVAWYLRLLVITCILALIKLERALTFHRGKSKRQDWSRGYAKWGSLSHYNSIKKAYNLKHVNIEKKIRFSHSIFSSLTHISTLPSLKQCRFWCRDKFRVLYSSLQMGTQKSHESWRGDHCSRALCDNDSWVSSTLCAIETSAHRCTNV